VLRIRNIYSGFEFFTSRIRIKGFRYFNPKNVCLSSRKYGLPGLFIPDPDLIFYLSRILIFYPSRIQGSKRHRIPCHQLLLVLLRRITNRCQHSVCQLRQDSAGIPPYSLNIYNYKRLPLVCHCVIHNGVTSRLVFANLMAGSCRSQRQIVVSRIRGVLIRIRITGLRIRVRLLLFSSGLSNANKKLSFFFMFFSTY
jgi:hypothetical protein